MFALCQKGSQDHKNEILKIRGFLLDTGNDGVVSLNDFSTKRDVVLYNEYVNSNEDELIKLFLMDSVYNQDVCSRYGLKWKRLFASNRVFGNKVDVVDLEPFIARYVKALALIGVHTYFSCDGWHRQKSKNMFVHIGFSDRYSLQWLRVLHKHSEILKVAQIPFLLDGEQMLKVPLGKERLKIYKLINSAAQAVYNNRKNLRNLKRQAISTLKGQKKDSKQMGDIYVLLSQAYYQGLSAEKEI